MSGITTGTGIFSGIDSRSLIDQLMAIESRPRQQVQSRVLQLQLQQSAYLDFSTRLTALRTAVRAFRESNPFQARAATSSNPDVLTATAGANAPVGSYSFIVDRLVSTQQMLSRGFANRDSAAVGVTSMTFESARARLDTDVSLSELNNGQGVERGRIVVTDSGGRTATIDLSRVATVNEVLEAINGNGTAQVTASVEGGRFVIADNANGTVSVSNAAGYNTASSLGLAGVASVGGKVSGSTVYGLNANTSLASLNDGRGVQINNAVGDGAFNFIIELGGTTPQSVRVNIGDVYQNIPPEGGGDPVLTRTQGAVTTVGGVITRINEALTAAGVSNVTASIDATNGRIVINDSTGTRPITVVENGYSTAADLGIAAGSPATTVNGRRILAGLNTTMLSGINGGQGFGGDGTLFFIAKDGTAFSTVLTQDMSIREMFTAIENASKAGGPTARLRMSLNSNGTGFSITDVSGGGGTLRIAGTDGSDTATSLGIATGVSGVASGVVTTANLQRQYIGLATELSTLNGGRGVGTGRFRITDPNGASAEIDIGTSDRTIADVVRDINNSGLKVRARINQTGDGIEVVENLASGPAGSNKIKIEDISGTVASGLRLAGEATGSGGSNFINGTFERTVTFSAADTLQQVVDKLNNARVGVNAAVMQDGSGSSPFRLSLTSGSAGESGRFLMNSVGTDMSMTTLEQGNNSRAFFGSSDPARGVLVGGASNTVDSVLQGVRIDLKGVSSSPVNLSITGDQSAAEAAVNLFVSAFNTLVERIDAQTKYDTATQRSGPLLGDSTALSLRSALYSSVLSPGVGTTGQFSRLTDVGITVGTGGRLQFDSNRFRDAMLADPASVESLFTTRVQENDSTITIAPGVTVRNPRQGTTFSALGVAAQMEQLADRYLDNVDGILTQRGDGLTRQITLQNNRIAAMDIRLASRRQILERQFVAMEQAIGQLQTQQSALSSLSQLRR